MDEAPACRKCDVMGRISTDAYLDWLAGGVCCPECGSGHGPAESCYEFGGPPNPTYAKCGRCGHIDLPEAWDFIGARDEGRRQRQRIVRELERRGAGTLAAEALRARARGAG